MACLHQDIAVDPGAAAAPDVDEARAGAVLIDDALVLDAVLGCHGLDELVGVAVAEVVADGDEEKWSPPERHGGGRKV